MSNEEFQKLVLEKLNSLDEIKTKVENIDKKITTVEKKQDKVIDMIRNLESNNTNRHVDIYKEIKKIKNDLNTIEKVTVKNWTDITELKEAK